MKCVYCHSDKVRVVDTRKYDTCVLRVRFCESCKCSFQTEEELRVPPAKKTSPILSETS